MTNANTVRVCAASITRAPHGLMPKRSATVQKSVGPAIGRVGSERVA
ncbi:hypothetical protein JKG68_20210 [Microvirga aerilata]|uniref:Uncharacterized protein n=1 Tax=Microvirga aerilata TaxID=670292 RepID=A0A936ZFM2_9HYPH|nr:hypothetical protein [Microvirga aerilata]MBL0406287.1 hypothetical protein [Microvirga aerilata]